MTTDVHTIAEDTSLREAIEMMEKYRVKRLPVLRGNQLVGIVTRANLLHALAALALVAAPPAKQDADIRQSILAEMVKQTWAPMATVNVVVQNGVVELWGVIMEDRQRAALKVLAENVPGVAKVVDHLVFVEPMSGIVIESAEGSSRERKTD
jgi:CBS-domain-containing membrane protein